MLPALDFLAEFTQNIPPKGSHLIRYYGFYSNKARGMRKKAQAQTVTDSVSQEQQTSTPAPRCSRTWAMLIKRVYEVDPLSCPKCGGVMKVVSFIEPPQAQVIERILKHCGLWQEPDSRPPPDINGLARDLDSAFSTDKVGLPGPDQAQDLIYEDIDTFLATF